MRSMAVNISTTYKFNGEFIRKINIKYLLNEVAFWLMHKTPFRLSGKLQWSDECETAALPVFSRDGQTWLFMLGKNLFYLKNKEKTPPFFSSESRLSLQKLFPSVDLRNWELLLGKRVGNVFFSVYLFAFVLYQCIINVEHLTLNSACNNKRNSASKLYVHTTTYTRHRSYVFIWTYSCQHTQARFFILGCLCTLWMFDMLLWTWQFFSPSLCCNNHSRAMPGSSEGSLGPLCDLCDSLHSALAETDMLGRHCKRRSRILRALFRLIDLNSAQLNLLIARLCLAVSLLWYCVVLSKSAAKSLSQAHGGHWWI